MKNSEIDKHDFSGWPIPDEYLVEIGRISVLWSALEESLNLAISILAGLDPYRTPAGFILVNHSSFPQRMDMFCSLCAMYSEEHEELRSYKEVHGKLKSAQKQRNKYIHTGMAPDKSTGKVKLLPASSRGTLKMEEKIISVADIKRAILDIDQAHTALYNMINKQKMLTFCERNTP